MATIMSHGCIATCPVPCSSYQNPDVGGRATGSAVNGLNSHFHKGHVSFSLHSSLFSRFSNNDGKSPNKNRRRNFSMRVVAKQAIASPPVISTRSGSNVLDCVVVGGGISGLTTALALMTEHEQSVPRVLVTEARERVGGNITTVEKDGYLWEEGPNSFQPNDSMLKCAVDVGLKDELVLADPDSPRFVLWGGRLRPVPAGLTDLPFFDLLSPFGKIRAGLGAVGLRPKAPEGKEESVEEFIRRNLGAEVFERLIEPFCSGVYAGDPSKLSMKAAFGKVARLEEQGGSIVGGSIKLIKARKDNPPPPRDPRLPKPKGQTVGSFRKGLATLPKAIAARLGEDAVKLSWELLKVEKTKEGVFRLEYKTPEGKKTLESRSVVLTVPSHVAAEIVRPLAGESAAALSSFYYPPVCAVTLTYPQSAVRDDRLVNGELKGFGQLHPRSQGVTTLGTLYSSSLFPGRAPPGQILLLCYIGGALNKEIATQTTEEIVAIVDKDMRKMLIKPDAPPATLLGLRLWPRAIPQFGIGHLEKLDAAKSGFQEAGLDGLFLGGNYVAGVALGRCVEGAYESANEIAKFVESTALTP
eukprot:TRINITY_DN26728_c0_g1_i1.p1 TRINITY_DN26728_c0_g1~~TRINITY_DN26728_c0_g1_i1.p1  ORF type:complete len:583 (-),score=118.96 TRINITY_DN26728_c0_g1_i1:385-2133(-)